MTAPIASTTAPPALRAGICCHFGTASALAQLTGELGRQTKYLDQAVFRSGDAGRVVGELSRSSRRRLDRGRHFCLQFPHLLGAKTLENFVKGLIFSAPASLKSHLAMGNIADEPFEHIARTILVLLKRALM